MKKYTSLSLALLLATLITYGKADYKYAVKNIADSMRLNANSVLRNSNTYLKVSSLDDVRIKQTYAVTILNAKAKSLATLQELYSNLSKLVNIEGKLYDSTGKEIKSMKMKDALDISSFAVSYTFHDDNRYKLFAFSYDTYPYTVEFEIEQVYKSSFFLPTWQPQFSLSTSVEQASFSLESPNGYTVRNHPNKMPANLVIEEKNTEKSNVTMWKFENVPATKYQPFSQEGNFQTPTLTFAPDQFKLMKYEGNMASWESLGKFMYQLNDGRDILADDVKAVVKRISDSEPDKRKKIQLLYEYMQKNTRYVANEYGISGWQTFDALSVGKTGYGDCKGLTNFMKAMLKEAGITAYTTLVSAGEYDYYKLDKNFPANTFNHVILCVPDGRDTVWIECTSQQLPSGYLGSFTQDRNVLVVTEKGGVLTHTPSYGAEKSYINRKAHFTFDKEKKQQSITVESRYSGLLQDDLLVQLKTQPEEKNKEILNSKFQFPSYQIASYKYNHLNTATPCIEEQVTALVSGISTATQKRTFLNINWLENPMAQIYQVEERTTPFVLKTSYSLSDSVTVVLPQGSTIESLPKKTTYNYPFGTYFLDVVQNGNEVLFVRRYQQNKGTFPASDYSAYQELYRTMENDSKKVGIVLLNQ